MGGDKETGEIAGFDWLAVTSVPLCRHDALCLFGELQAQGCLPYMVEEEFGRYRVGCTVPGRLPEPHLRRLLRA